MMTGLSLSLSPWSEREDVVFTFLDLGFLPAPRISVVRFDCPEL